LDDAFARYEASLHLSACLSQRYETWFAGRNIAIGTLRRMRGWAAHPKQTTARVEKALLQIHNLNNQTRPLSVVLQAEWEKWLGAREKLANPIPESPIFVSRRSARPDSSRLAHPILPWEAARDRRIVNALFEATLLGVEEAERGLRTEGWLSPNGPGIKRFEERCFDALRWLSTTPSMNRDQCVDSQDILLAFVNSEARRRMELIAVALAAFRREHGHDAASLHELLSTNRPNLCDPWTGRDFYYVSGTRESVFLEESKGTDITDKNGNILSQVVGGGSRRTSISNKATVLVSEGFAQYRPPFFRSFINRPLMTQGTESGSAIIVVLHR
jgi:hypothetical protein